MSYRRQQQLRLPPPEEDRESEGDEEDLHEEVKEPPPLEDLPQWRQSFSVLVRLLNNQKFYLDLTGLTPAIIRDTNQFKVALLRTLQETNSTIPSLFHFQFGYRMSSRGVPNAIPQFNVAQVLDEKLADQRTMFILDQISPFEKKRFKRKKESDSDDDSTDSEYSRRKRSKKRRRKASAKDKNDELTNAIKEARGQLETLIPESDHKYVSARQWLQYGYSLAFNKKTLPVILNELQLSIESEKQKQIQEEQIRLQTERSASERDQSADSNRELTKSLAQLVQLKTLELARDLGK